MLIEWITCFAIRSIQAWRYGSLDLHQVVASTLAVPGSSRNWPSSFPVAASQRRMTLSAARELAGESAPV